MDIDIKQVSLFGMELQRSRVEAATLNINNAQLVFSNEESTVRPVFASPSIANFSTLIDQDSSVSLLPVDSAGVKTVYKPEHALSNDEGYIFKPDINIASEMVNLNQATRAYEASVKAFNTYKEMGAKALEIGK